MTKSKKNISNNKEFSVIRTLFKKIVETARDFYDVAIKHKQALIIVIISIIVICFFYFIYTYSFRMLFWDQWDIVSPVIKSEYGLGLFEYKHNEHRIGTGLFITKFLARITHWNNLAETAFIGLLFVCIYIINYFAKIKNKISLQSFFVSLIIFNLNQWGNLTWGFQISFVLPIFFLYLCLGIITLNKPSIKREVIVALISLLSTRSSFHGVFIPASMCIVYLLEIFKYNGKYKHFLVWIVINLLVTLSYFINFTSISTGNSFNLERVSKYSILLINNFVGYRHLDLLSLFIAFYMLYYALRAFKKTVIAPNKADYFVVVPIIFSSLFILATSIGRSHLGIEQALSSRYNTVVFPFFLSILYFIDSSRTRIGKIIFTLIITFSFISGMVTAIDDLNMYAFKKGTDAWKNCFIKTEDAYHCQLSTQFLVYPDIEKLKINEKLLLLKEKRMNVYSPFNK